MRQRPTNELLHSDLPRGIKATRRLLAYLLRAARIRMVESKLGRERMLTLASELGDALLALVVAHRSTLAVFQALATRFTVDLTGGESEHGPLEVWLAEGRARWDHVCAAIDYSDLRTVVREAPDFFATFACARPSDRDEDSLFEAFPEPPMVATYRPSLPLDLISPRSYRAVWTLTSPAFHGADTKTGNIALFRRHTVPDPLTGRTFEVPFIAGNAIRGQKRDLAVGLHLSCLGLKTTDIPTSRAHALLAGGAIDKGADTGTVNNEVRRRARDLCPPWDLLAGCIDQQIMAGRGRISDATLVCRETAWKVAGVIAPGRDPRDLAAELPSCEDLMELRQLTRHKHADIANADGVQMLVNFELVREGSQFVHAVQLWGIDQVSEVTASFLAYLLEEFRALGSLGVGAARGFGSFAFDGYMPGANTRPLPPPDIYLATVERRKQEMIDWIMAVDPEATEPEHKDRSGKRRRNGAAEATA